MSDLIFWIGAGACVSGGLSVVALLLVGCAKLSNRAQNALIESYGGWKVFLEYRDWYHKHKRQAK